MIAVHQKFYEHFTWKSISRYVAIAIGQVMNKYKYLSSYNWSAVSDFSVTPEAARLIRDIGVNCLLSYNYDIKEADYGPEWVYLLLS